MTYPSSGSDSGAQPWQPPPSSGYPQGGYGQPAAPGYPGAAPGHSGFPGFGQAGGYPPPGAYPMGSGFPGGYPAGPGFPGAVPPRQGLPKAAIFGGLGVLAVVVVVLGVVFWPSGGGLFSSDADQIKALMHTKIDPSDTSAMKAHHCAADGSLIDKFAKYGRAPSPSDTSTRAGTKIEVGEPKINGNTATVDITATSGSYTLPVTQYFRKEGGEWKYCSNDDPKMRNLSNLPGMN